MLIFDTATRVNFDWHFCKLFTTVIVEGISSEEVLYHEEPYPGLWVLALLMAFHKCWLSNQIMDTINKNYRYKIYIQSKWPAHYFNIFKAFYDDLFKLLLKASSVWFGLCKMGFCLMKFLLMNMKPKAKRISIVAD